ncbi:NADPH:quinone reductase [Actinoplanes lobatus]|uniref:NADPH2:quinone reductase n=1 Tax=Actinoplanes lobatus TaxID=113568 RepID=A0A7W7HHA5_9ACTN|nr:zinc-binding dehydrogenase [Actinoplanes lobatus]MBB4750516.1 NADPH2:quinone reductase [Actinoplanes lobatus]GGN90345.1 NADPH:quinone reductase [Actinoplanes lobatus]GIE43806.1 NADPH:quinone reductase [Actinoplanes lobatus]
MTVTEVGTMRAIQVSRFGGPEALKLAELPDPVPGPGQLLIQVTGAGVNFADTSRVAGSYQPAPALPFVPGTEVVGTTADGRRVLALNFAGGGYAERAVVDAATTVEVPAQVGDATALALLVQGLTAWHVLRGSARLRDGETVVIGAAAGGVGSLAVRLARHFGAGLVIAAASTPEKREKALRLGADVALDSAPDGFAERVRDATGGRGADVVLESTGGAAFTAGLDALAPFGRLVTFGNASRQGRPPVDPGELSDRNLAVAGFWLRPVVTLPGHFREPLTELFALAVDGRLTLPPGPAYPLDEAHRAHRDLIGRRTTGKVILRP